jgi:YegS/Rv2252/BmrU family lipid kinase
VPDHLALIANPASGSFSLRRFDQALKLLRQNGLAPEVLMTRSAEDGRRFATELCQRHRKPLIIASGGDGTVNDVLNGITTPEALLAVLPLGTTNVLARELGISSVADAVRRIVRGESRPLPVGLLESDSGVRRHFLLMAGIGIDGAVVAGVRGAEKGRFGKGAYLLAAYRMLRDWPDATFTVSANGTSRECHTLIVSNAVRYGGSFRLAPAADLFAPSLELVCLSGCRRRDYLRFALALLFGYRGDTAGVERIPAQEAVISGNAAIQLDGDFVGHAPARISVSPAFVRLVV